jgi:hypothetical protein
MNVLPTARARPIPSLDMSSPELHLVPKLVQAAQMGVTSTDLGYTVNALVDGAYATDSAHLHDDHNHGSGTIAAGHASRFLEQTLSRFGECGVRGPVGLDAPYARLGSYVVWIDD